MFLDFGWQRFKSRWLPSTKQDLKEMEGRIMATQQQLAEDLRNVAVQQKKTIEEIKGVQLAVDELKTKIVDLEKIINDGGAGEGPASQELTDAVAEVKAQAQIVDDQIPEPPAPVVIPV